MGNLKFKNTMTDDAKTDDAAAAKWTYTAVKDGGDCWADLKHYATTDCTGDATAAAADPPVAAAAASAAGKQGGYAVFGAGDAAASYMAVKACDATKIALHPFATGAPATVPGAPTADEITAAMTLASGASATVLTYK